MASQDVSGELPEALWRRFGGSWEALGALFGSLISTEKQFFPEIGEVGSSLTSTGGLPLEMDNFLR